MYSKWSQGNQGSYQVQFAQYINCIFWSDNPYVSDVSKRTNLYTLYLHSTIAAFMLIQVFQTIHLKLFLSCFWCK